MPVMEGKAMLFKELAGVDAFPLCLSTTDVDEIVRIVEGVAPTFGGINLEDIAAPRCFEIERRLKESLDIPVFHDDQHGTAVVVLAALLNALRVVGKDAERRARRDRRRRRGRAWPARRSSSSTACSDLVVCDIGGILHPDRDGPHGRAARRWPRAPTRAGCTGTANDALAGADVVVGVSAPGRVHRRRRAHDGARTRSCSRWPTRRPRSSPRRSGRTSRSWPRAASDYPNQINNVLAFPGIFRGALDVRARGIDEAMKLAAARAIAGVIPESDLGPEYIVPSVFNRAVAPAVADAVAEAAIESGIARRERASRQAEIRGLGSGADGGRGLVVDLDEAQVVVGDLVGGGVALELLVEEALERRSTRSSGRSRSR